MGKKYDLIIIGGGPGGYVAAIRASQLGLRTAIVEEKELGGTCLNRGCIPTKALLHAADRYRLAKQGADFGILIEGVRFDYQKICEKKDTVVKQLRAGVEYLVKSNQIDIFQGRATIKSRNTVEVAGREKAVIQTDRMIVATGSRPSKLPIPGIDGPRVLDSDQVLAMVECPSKVVIIGGGVIGVEFATLYNNLEKEVTILEMADSLVPGMDQEVSAALRRSLESRGVRVWTGAKVLSVASGQSAICTYEAGETKQVAEGDIVIAAVGRRPNVENLGLENVGIVLEKGFIKVNDRMETSVPGIYAIGDVTGKMLLAHAASAQGLVAAANAAGQNRMMDNDRIPGCIYTDPEIAVVGLTEEEAVKRGISVKIGRFPVGINGKALLMGEKEGFAKIITEEQTGEILGAHLMGPRVTDMISELCIAMKLESTIEELSDTIHPHPTISEIILEAAHDVNGTSVHKPRK